MSVTVRRETVDPGDDAYVDSAWALKERIRSGEGVLKQRRNFFTRAYRRARCYLYLDGDDVVAFAVARTDGYLLFLGVDPTYRREGFGERLVATVAEDCDAVTCHARATNESALEFYEEIGFERVRCVENYYEDGGDAYYLRLGEESRLIDRLSEFLLGSDRE